MFLLHNILHCTAQFPGTESTVTKPRRPKRLQKSIYKAYNNYENFKCYNTHLRIVVRPCFKGTMGSFTTVSVTLYIT